MRNRQSSQRHEGSSNMLVMFDGDACSSGSDVKFACAIETQRGRRHPSAEVGDGGGLLTRWSCRLLF